MAPPSAARSFAITLAIAIAVIGPESSGFAINRKNSTLSTTPSTDLSDENFQLQVKDDLKRLKDVKLNTDGESSKTATSDDILSPKVIKQSFIATISIPPSSTTKGIRTTTEDTRIPTISSDTVEVFDSVEDTDFKNSKKKKENFTETSSQHAENKDKTTDSFSKTKLSTIPDQIAAKSDEEKSSVMTEKTTEMTTESMDTPTKNVAQNIDNTEASSITTDFLPTITETTFLTTISTDDSSTPNESSLSSSLLSDTDVAQTTTDASNDSTTEPQWEKYTKYTTITRKRNNSFEDTSQTTSLDNDSMKAETSNTQLNIEKMLEFSSIPPLLKKHINLLSTINHPTLSVKTDFEEAEKTTVSMQSTIYNNVNTTEPKRKETVETKRAGFLDNTEKASSPLDAPLTSTVKNDNDTTMFEVVDDSDTESPDFKKASLTNSESQSQLAEDAIQEELLKEETLNDHNENVNRYQDEKKNQGDKDDQSGPEAPPPAESDVSLNVQPINHERSKTTLYTVSPSYKPMKKIDVQPAKPFVRDPDDNSWRNESISSLGIVFKPKVSSKSFKEVLKNKTQTELNNLQEKDTKDDVPDLRVRLEKIAEVRKTKKKMNKDGEEVYSDYEEGNSAETSTLKTDMMSSLLSPAEISRLLTPFNFPTDLELTTPTNNDLDTTKAKTKIPLPSRGPTTKKPKKLFNLAEYYDTTDEYDSDYFKMSNIDLKKFTQSPKTTQTPVTYPIGPLQTRPTQPHFADRKPTVQYFPPREPLKVNVNNKDPDFERKVNLFTFKEDYNTRPQIATVPSVPVATEKPESEMRPPMLEMRPDLRPTVKPSDLSMYTTGELSKSYGTIAVIGPESSGFAINRKNSTLSTTPSTDLSDENFQLQVKDDLKRLKDVKLNTDGESSKTATSDDILSPKVIKQSFIATISIPPSSTTKGIRTTTEDTRIPTISSDTVEVFDSVEDTDFKNSKKKKENFTETSSQHAENKDKTTDSFSKTKLSTIPDQIAAKSDEEKSSVMTEKTTEMTTESMDTPTKNVAQNIDNTEASSITTDFLPTITETTFLTTISTDDSSTPNESSLSSSLLSDTDVAQTTTDASNDSTTEPQWEKYTKYTTITRKRNNSFEDTSQTTSLDNDSMKAETSNTQLNIEKMLEFSSIPPLLKKHINLLSTINHPTLSVKTDFEEAEKTTVSMQSTIYNNVNTTEPKRKETVETKRAGFLDNTEKASSPLDAPLTSTVKNDNDTTMFEVVDDSDTESPDFKKASLTNSESQSQLAEDAIQEELLKEETLNDHNENVNRYQDEKKNQGDKDDQSGPEAPPPAESDVSLNVQPINHERSKTTLYTVSPSYKPMKKIDVQPAKPFVRDPDDNSWRNESISSLGIVFKPKVSSKSFKEVLKNKTQTELNNLQEKDTKDDVPDLRVRLEKIAEVRKTKKKMNKDGEEVYSDYEEGNSAETSTLKTDMMSSLLSPAEISRLLTPFNFPTDLELTTPTNNDLDTTKAKTKIPLPSRGPTTKKPKKLFNLAEYYDTTDEYDSDYFKMSNIDLKKFTQSPKTTQTPVTYPIGPLQTRPTQPHFADRKPTVQYFPPREPLKVNVNNKDPDFERKVNLFTFKEDYNTRPQIATVPSVPVATEKPESEMRPPMLEMRPDLRPTVKPSDLSMYTTGELSKSYYLTNAPRMTEPESFVTSDGSLNRGSYIIKHYKDFLDAAVKDVDYERHAGFLPYDTPTEPPRDVTAEPEKPTPKFNNEENDYDTHFRKEVLNRFVDNFNQNSERFKVDFPILYNNSVVHRKGDGGPPASSRAFLKRLYDGTGTATKAVPLKKPCEPQCDVTVELSPAYELHYYVPGQEEREEPSGAAPYR